MQVRTLKKDKGLDCQLEQLVSAISAKNEFSSSLSPESMVG